ncbi:MAG: hypothetical protein VZR26_11715, partial [Erysipelotrichaceae bacterium]|nr:hypothetical protein [Erysipelotrichaceae bacterium]
MIFSFAVSAVVSESVASDSEVVADSVDVTSLVVASVAIVVFSADASVKALVPVVSVFPAHPLIQIAEDRSRISSFFFIFDQPFFLSSSS